MLKVGDTVYTFNHNRRIYSQDKNQHGPIYAEHFFPVLIVGETRISWLTEYGGKYKKIYDKHTPDSLRLFTEEEKDRAVWLYENQYKISEQVRKSNDYDKLRKIKEILDNG